MGRVVGLKSKPRIDADDLFFNGLRGNEKNKAKVVSFSESWIYSISSNFGLR